LERVSGVNKYTRDLVQKALLWIAFADPPLTINEMCQALSVPLRDESLDDASEIDEPELALRCSSLIRKSNDERRFEFAHFTVKQFLQQLDPSDSKYGAFHLSESRAAYLMAMSELRFLTLTDFSRLPTEQRSELSFISKRNVEHPFYEYASMSWHRAATDHWDDPELISLAMKLFDPGKVPVFVSWSVEFCRHYQTGSWSSWCMTRDRESAFDLSDDLDVGRNPELGGPFQHPNRREDGPKDGISLDHEPSGSDFIVYDYAETTHDLDESGQDSEGTSATESSSAESQHPSDNSDGSGSRSPPTRAQTFSSGSRYFQEPSTTTSRSRNHAQYQSPSIYHLMELIYYIRRNDFMPLHMASLLGLLKICERLVNRDQNVNLASMFGTPLHFALLGPAIIAEIDFIDDREASWGRENIKPSDDVVALLINSGSSCTGSLRTRFHNYSIASWSLILLDLTGNRQTLSHVLLTIPPLDGALQTFRSLCRWWAEPPGSIGQNRSKMKKVLDTLSAAAETSGGELLRYLDLFEDVARQTFPSTSSDMQLIRSPGHTLDELREMIEKCIRYNDEQNLQRLIQVAEATVNFAGWKSGDIESLLGLAVSHRSVAILSYLLRKFQERSRTDISVIVLFLRCTGEGMEDLMSCLLENGLRTDAQNDNGDTIWHIAVQEKRDSVQKLEYLFTNCPSSDFINAMQVTNRKGRTALADALRHNNYKAASAIASHCHSVVGVLKCNSPPLGSLVADIKSVKLLRELGAAGLLPQMDDLDGDTPLHYLSEDTNFDVIEALLSLYSYQRGKDDKTPLEVYLSHKLYDRDSLGVAKRLMKEEVESFSAQSTHRTWQYLSAKLLGSLGSVEVDVVFDLASEFIEMGGLLSYETQYQISGLYELRVAFHEKNLIEISASRSLRYKTKMAELLIRVLEKTSFPQYLEKDDEAIQILLWSVVVNQPALIVLLLQRGVDIHKKVNGLSTLEFCCLHASNINPEAFSELLGGLDVSKIDDLDHSPEGLGLVHILGQPRVPNPPKPPSQVRVQRDGPLPRKAAAGPLPPGPPPPPPQSPSRGVTRTEALSRRLELLRQLLEKGADPNLATRASRMKPLAWHLARGWVENAKLLLKYGADCGPESADKTGWGPVAIACSRGSVGDVGFLEEVLSQTDIDVELFFRIKTDTSIVIYNKIRRHVLGASLLHIAAIWGRAKMIEFLLDHSLMPDIDIKAFDDLTPLHVATIANQNNVVKLLASRGANINAISRGRNTPLHFAISPDRHDVLRTLLELGPIHLADSNNNTPLDLAFKSKSPELVKLIQDSFEFQGVVSSGQFHRSAAALSGALESFIEADDVEGCKRLFDQGCPRDIAMRSCHECSPLLHALYRGRFTIGMWLANNNADLLGTLCGKHSNRLAERLVDYDDSDEYSGEDSDEDSGYNDDDPNDCFSNWTLLDVLITDKELGEENLSKWLSMIPDQQLRWLLENSIATHLAIVCGNCEGLQLLLTHCHNRPSLTFDKTLIQGLVNKFASVDKKAPKSPLHRAAACIDCTKILLEHGADVTISDMSGRQPLHGAVRKRDVAVVNYLLDAGAPIDARDTASNQTPLGHAVTNNLPEMVQLLIKRGADWRVKTQLGSLLWSACSALVLGQLLDLGLDPSDCESSLFPMWIISRNDFDKMSPTLDASFFQLVSLAAKVDPPARIIFWRFLEYTETLGHGRYFTLLCRRMGTGLLHPLFEGQGEDKFSALSYVLRTNPIVTLRELLRLGCNIEYEDQYNKTALMVAASEGRMEAVKFLVRSGARIQYKIGDAWTSAVIEAQKYPPIIDWLLKERFQEQQKLDMGTERQSGSTSSDKDDVRPWSGFQTKRFLLAGRYKRRWKESMLEYAIRLHRIRREQWGKVIVTLSEEREEVWCNDKPETADE
jgi:ankyrin repeat protein